MRQLLVMVGPLDGKANKLSMEEEARKLKKVTLAKKRTNINRRDKVLILKQIRDAEVEGKTDTEIAKLLNMKLSTYYRTWVPKLYEQDAIVVESFSRKFIHHQYILLRDRLLGVLARATYRAENAKSEGVQNQADQLVEEVAINLFRLHKDGPSALGIKVKALEETDRKQAQASGVAEDPTLTKEDAKIAKTNNLQNLPGYGNVEQLLDKDEKEE